MIAQGVPIFVALEPVDLRMGAERLGALVRERMRAEPRSRALFVFVGKRGHSMKVLTWDGTGTLVVYKKLDAGRFELPRPTTPGEHHLVIRPKTTSGRVAHSMRKRRTCPHAA